MTNEGLNFADTQTNVGGMTSELLDHYEEGTWTPTSEVGTLSLFNHAVYTKIGREVQVHASVTFGSTSNATAQRIAGFPFTSSATSYGSGTVGWSGYTNYVLQIIIFGSSTVMCFYPTNSTSQLDAAAFANLRHDFTIHYNDQ